MQRGLPIAPRALSALAAGVMMVKWRGQPTDDAAHVLCPLSVCENKLIAAVRQCVRCFEMAFEIPRAFATLNENMTAARNRSSDAIALDSRARRPRRGRPLRVRVFHAENMYAKQICWVCEHFECFVARPSR